MVRRSAKMLSLFLDVDGDKVVCKFCGMECLEGADEARVVYASAGSVEATWMEMWVGEHRCNPIDKLKWKVHRML